MNMDIKARSDWRLLGSGVLIVFTVVMMKWGRGMSASISPETPWLPLFTFGGLLGAATLLVGARKLYLRHAKALAWGNIIVAGLLAVAVLAAWNTSPSEASGQWLWAAASFAAGVAGIVLAMLHLRLARRSGEAVETKGSSHR